VSLSSDDTPTGPIGAAGMMGPPPRDRAATADRARRWNVRRDVVGCVLVVIAALLPWNLYFGVGIPDSNLILFAVLAAVTLLSLVSIAVTQAGPGKLSSPRFNPGLAGRLRLFLNLPYLLLVLAFVAFDAFETIRSGGTVHVPGGVGPGGWLGVAGAVLCAQPVVTGTADDDHTYRRWLRGAQITGYASMFGAALSFGFNLCWRIRYALHGPEGSAFGKQNIAVILTAVVYGVVALAAVLVASRWLLQGTKASRFAGLAIGASTLVAGIVVWSLPVGRQIDAFHGIAQNTSTAGVGYEGYLAWAAAAAIFAPLTLFGSPSTTERDVWRTAVRKGLLLIAVWCLGSVLMRSTDLVVSVMLNYPFSRYDTMTLAAFDLATAILALWLRINLANKSLSPRLVTSLSGFLFALTVSRVIVGVVLAPRFQDTPGAAQNPVYGNDLAQQITSTFDVVLCGLALCILAAAIIAGRLRQRRPRRIRRRRPAAAPVPGQVGQPGPDRAGGPPLPSEAKTSQFSVAGTAHDPPTTVLSGQGGSPRIFRSGEAAQQPRPKIFRPPGNQG
jgi:hypothetical protein